MPSPREVEVALDAITKIDNHLLRVVSERAASTLDAWDGVRALRQHIADLERRVAEAEKDGERLLVALDKYAMHDNGCVAGQWRKGEPVGEGKYRNLYGHGADEKWYYGKDRPACKCGLDAAMAQRDDGTHT